MWRFVFVAEVLSPAACRQCLTVADLNMLKKVFAWISGSHSHCDDCLYLSMNIGDSTASWVIELVKNALTFFLKYSNESIRNSTVI